VLGVKDGLFEGELLGIANGVELGLDYCITVGSKLGAVDGYVL
jgi:hypothetical protein